MRKIYKNLYPIIFITLMIFLFLFVYYNKLQIKESYEIVTGKVIGYKHSGRVSWGIKYEFKIKGKTIINYYEYKHVKLPYGTIVPVLYSSSDPDLSQLLLIPKDFKEYGLPYPDSLKRLETYINKHKAKNFWE